MTTVYKIEIRQVKESTGIKTVINGQEENSEFISLVDDGLMHEVQVIIGEPSSKTVPEMLKT